MALKSSSSGKTPKFLKLKLLFALLKTKKQLTKNMKTGLIFPKGTLTATGVVTFLLSRLPTLAEDIANVKIAFIQASQTPLDVIAVAGVIGALYGWFRRIRNYGEPRT